MTKTNKKKGFTLIELVVVIAIIGILAAVLIPGYNYFINKANESSAKQEAQSYALIYQSAYIEFQNDSTLKDDTYTDANVYAIAMVNAEKADVATKLTTGDGFTMESHGYVVTVTYATATNSFAYATAKK